MSRGPRLLREVLVRKKSGRSPCEDFVQESSLSVVCLLAGTERVRSICEGNARVKRNVANARREALSDAYVLRPIRIPTSEQRGVLMKHRSITPEIRSEHLEQQRNAKMARSAHCYVRGATANFYKWLGSSKIEVPTGPALWICGDCHVGNLGPVADVKGRVDVQIRDLDQTVIGNPAHDLIRLGLSLAMAARGSNLPGLTTAKMTEHLARGYIEALRQPDEKPKDNSRIVDRIVQLALRRRWKNLANERIDDPRPTIPRGSKFWDLSRAELDELTSLFERQDIRRLITALSSRPDEARVRILDAAYWIKGCSSLGKLRYAVVVRVGAKGSKREVYALVDIKEAVAPLAPVAPNARMPVDNAARVVEGARNLSPNLGERMLAAHLAGRPVIIRELLPQDLKLDIETLPQSEALAVGHYLGSIVGKAHARQLDDPSLWDWAQKMRLDRPGHLNAPAWLWTMMVELAGAHESAYLDHCRAWGPTVALFTDGRGRVRFG
jgi:uncharacterized protein (DUF2252 family)